MINSWKASLQQVILKWDDDRAWSSQEWKTEIKTNERSARPDKTSWKMIRKVRPGHEEILLDGTAQSVRNEETLRDRSGRPDINSQEEARPQQFVIGNDETELELSVESRSFVNRVNDQVRKRQKRISNVAGEGEEHSMIWGMFMAVTMESAEFMEKNYQNNCHSIANTTDLTHKQKFDISTQKVSEQDEISGLETKGWKNHSWKYLSTKGDERNIINLQHTKVYIFSDSVLCLGKIQQNPESVEAWEKRIGWIKCSQSYSNFDRIDGEPTEFEWNVFPGFNTLQLSDQLKSLLYRLGETPENTGRILFMSMFNDISCGTKDNEKECLANARRVSLYARRFGKGEWSFKGPGSEKKWYSMKEDSPQEIWDHLAEKMLLEFAESGCPIFRATTPLSRGQLKSKGHGKLSIHFAAVKKKQLRLFFA